MDGADVGYGAGGGGGLSDGERVGKLVGNLRLWIWTVLSDWWLERGLPWERHMYDEVTGRTWWEGTGSIEEDQLVR